MCLQAVGYIPLQTRGDSLEAGPHPHGGDRGPGLHHRLARVDSLRLGPVSEGREFALERPTWLGLGGVEDGVTGPEVAPVSIEQLVDTDGVVGAQGRPVHSV